MRAEILTLLRESDHYISGQELCNQFGVSRTAVWKAMNQLKEEGYEIEAIKNKGYRLMNQPDVLSKKELESRIKTTWAGSEIVFFEQTGSTNTDVKKLLEEGKEHGILVVANAQSNGKGRRGRDWVSPNSGTISMSIGLRPDMDPAKASMLTLVMALSVCKAIQEYTDLPVSIKWPNDIVISNKKVCGILTEMNMEKDYIHWVVIGVGINVNLMDIPEELKETATSLKLACGKEIARSGLIEKIMLYFENDYALFMECENLSMLQEVYNDHLINMEKQVRVLDAKAPFMGIAKGINQNGELLVQKEQGEIVAVNAGEVSVRGLYGYV